MSGKLSKVARVGIIFRIAFLEYRDLFEVTVFLGVWILLWAGAFFLRAFLLPTCSVTIWNCEGVVALFVIVLVGCQIFDTATLLRSLHSGTGKSMYLAGCCKII